MHLRREKLALQYAIKIKSTPKNPANQIIFDPNYEDLYANKRNTIPPLGIRIKTVLQKVCLDINVIPPSKMIEIPTWTVPPVKIDLSLAENKKYSLEARIQVNTFRELKNKYENNIPIYTDGSKDDDKVGAGIIIEAEMQKLV